MNTRQELVTWVAAALSATTVLAAAAVWEQRREQSQWSIFLVGAPHVGAGLFYGRADCAHCH